MNNEELINRKFEESVKGINERILANHENWYNYVINLPIHLRVVYTIVILHQQVFNGGFHQYFFNGYGLFGYLTLDSLKIIKANFGVALLQKVLEKVNDNHLDIKVFKNKVYNRELNKIVNFDDELADYLENCDDEYYELEEDLMKLLGQYLEKIELSH